MRNFGLGRKSLEQWIIEEAGCLCAAFTDQAGRPFNPNTLLNKAVCNVISSLTFARRFTYEDPYFIRMLKVMNESLQ
ncbi:cytochrome P450, partial [Klebsiella pneumoniae]|nr:cytochrome P450 [Klebsiella pneumoniae]